MDAFQWASNRAPTPFQDLFPRTCRASGYCRESRTSATRFYKFIKEVPVFNEDALWVVADSRADESDKLLVAMPRS